ncbi:ABC transporter ATP-binding protein [Halomonas cerina]|uniref:Putative ABC transport system ATP-binding protein n=1 Tax=Halomonas cerina TaxID=447424 RepID=A0A839VA90_9GAMM|nr:ATP-binding cassette domain-containing protein [Halomonas cerina]MBB3192402.1 putative ABC transport system ATP-binding protein [Halomonas cerina]
MFRLEDVRKHRAQGDSAFELQVPSLEIHPGEMIAVVGESGCGKSTLLDLLALVLRPTSSQVFRFTEPNTGHSVDAAALWAGGHEDALAHLRRAHMGYVLQTGGLLPFLDVRRNIELSARVSGREPVAVSELASQLGIDNCLDRMPAALSIGQRQRVAIARAVAHGPALVLADEPTAAVDKARGAQIMERLAMLARQQGTAVVVVTHDRPLVEPLVARGYGFAVSAISDELTVSVCRPLERWKAAS